MKRFVALVSIFLLASPVGTTLAVEALNVNIDAKSSNVELNMTPEEEIELAKAFEAFEDSGNISLEDISKNAVKMIETDSNLSASEKEAKVLAIEEVLQEAKSTNRSLGFSYVKPGPGRIRIFIPPLAVKIVFAIGVSAYVLSILETAGVSLIFAGIVANVVYEAISDQSAVRNGFTLHGWNNYRSWNFRVGNTLGG